MILLYLMIEHSRTHPFKCIAIDKTVTRGHSMYFYSNMNKPLHVLLVENQEWNVELSSYFPKIVIFTLILAVAYEIQATTKYNVNCAFELRYGTEHMLLLRWLSDIRLASFIGYFIEYFFRYWFESLLEWNEELRKARVEIQIISISLIVRFFIWTCFLFYAFKCPICLVLS